MKISEQRLRQFIIMYKEDFGIELSSSEAYEKASLLLQYARFCAMPLAKADEGGINNESNASE